MLRAIWFGAFAVSVCGALSGQHPSAADVSRSKLLEQRRKQYPDLAKLIDLAQTLSPEFSADVLLRIVESGRLRDSIWKQEILDQAFQTAGLARETVRRSVARNQNDLIGLDVVARSRAEMMTLGFDQRLDRLTLQVRAVREMVKLDRHKALDLFRAIAFPSLHQCSCEEALVDDVSEYYGTLAQLADSAFSPAERRLGKHVDLLGYKINGITSPVEVGPLAKALSSANLDGEELKLLAGSFASNLDRFSSDDRSFSAALPLADTEVQKLVETLRARGASPDRVISAYRVLLIQSFTGRRCADNTGEHDPLTQAIASFNRALASDNPILAPIVTANMKSGGVDGRADLGLFFSDAEFDRGFQHFMALLVGEGHDLLNEPLSDDQKNSLEWRSQFDDFLHQIDEFKAGVGESEYRYFYRKATILTALLGTAPPGVDREKVVRQFVRFLNSSNFRAESMLGWYAQVERTATAVRELTSPEQYTNFLNLLEQSGDPVLAVYALRIRTLPSN
jgi:hypothetical protein